MAEKEAERRSVDGRIKQLEYNEKRLKSMLDETRRELETLRKRRQELCPHRRVVRTDQCPDRCDLWNYDSAGFGSMPPEVRMCEDCGFAGANDGWTDHVALFGDNVRARTVAEEEFQRLYDLFPHFRF